MRCKPAPAPRGAAAHGREHWRSTRAAVVAAQEEGWSAMQLVPDCRYSAADAHTDMGAAVAALEGALRDLDMVYRDWTEYGAARVSVLDAATAADVARLRSDLYRLINDATLVTTRYGMRFVAPRSTGSAA